MNASEYWHHFSSSSESTGMVTSSTFSVAPPFFACTKQRLKGMFFTHSVRASEYTTSGKKCGSRHSVYMSDTERKP